MKFNRRPYERLTTEELRLVNNLWEDARRSKELGQFDRADALTKQRERVVNRGTQRARLAAKRNGRKPRAYKGRA